MQAFKKTKKPKIKSNDKKNSSEFNDEFDFLAEESHSSKEDMTPEESSIVGELLSLDSYRELGVEDLREYGDLAKKVYVDYALPNKRLDSNIAEFMCFNINAEYTANIGYFGDVDIECDAEITQVNIIEAIKQYVFDISDEDLALIEKQEKQ